MSDIPENPKVFRRLAAILAADIAGYSALMGADEEATVRDLKGHQAVVLPMIGTYGGRIIDTAGDGILAEFPSVLGAVKCALAIQKVMAERNAAVDQAKRMQFRIGINQGDIVVDHARVYGDGVNVAARLENIAAPGGICISAKVHDEINGRVDAEWKDLGLQSLKNITQPVRVYQVHLVSREAPVLVTKASLTLPDKPSIAVLSFTNLSGDKEQEYFSDGVTEDIITELSRFSELFVIARNSSFQYKDKSVDVRQIGRELGVRYVVEGSIRRAGDRVRITAQLIEAATGAHCWADRYDRELKDIFVVQDEVARAIVVKIAGHVNLAEIERAKRKPTESLGAYDIYLRGVANRYKFTREANEEALRLFYKAIELDSEYSAACAAAAMCFNVRKAYGWIVNKDQEIAEVRRLARQAVQSGRNDATTLSLAGYVLAYVAGELDEGVALIDRALALNSNSAVAWRSSGWTRIWLGEPDLAVEHFARAMRLSPVDPVFSNMQEGTAHAHFFAGRHSEALSWARMALNERPYSHTALRIAAASSALAGSAEQATTMMARLRERDPALRVSNLHDILGSYHPEHITRYENALRKAGLPE